MARPRDEGRRAALLEAATQVFAAHGVAAPTAMISKTAGVSEGSFFTYFKTKDDLINELYRHLRLELAAAITGGFPTRAGLRERLQHVFTRYVGWGAAHPVARRALRQVSMSTAIRPEVRRESAALFAEVERLHLDAIAQRRLQVSPLLASQALKALAEMTMDLIAQQPEQGEALMAAGLQMLWGALTSKP